MLASFATIGAGALGRSVEKGGSSMRTHLTVLLAMVGLLLATAAPAFAAPPDCAGPGSFNPGYDNNCGVSLEHRANPSGKGNFGQCARISAGDPTVIREFNPSSQNTGECDVRFVSGRGGENPVAISIIRCEPPLEPVAESQLTFRPSLSGRASTACV